jgi:hypothetical protein
VTLRTLAIFVAAMAASLLPRRVWGRLPGAFSMTMAAFASGLATFFAGAAVGIPGFLAHAHATTSLAIDAQLQKAYSDGNAGYSQGLSQGFAGLSIFTFLLLTPLGWLTLYLMVGGGLRMLGTGHGGVDRRGLLPHRRARRADDRRPPAHAVSADRARRPGGHPPQRALPAAAAGDQEFTGDQQIRKPGVILADSNQLDSLLSS